jgi:hypothetical protein
MTRSGTAYRLQPLAPLTGGTASGLWPTPVAHDDGKTPEAHLAMKARMKGGPRQTITSLNVMVKAIERGMWPTPRATDGDKGGGLNLRTAVKEWATPTAHPRTHTPRQVDHGEQLANQVGGALNPTWVEWLMGFPLGWTDCGPSATPSSPKSPSGSGTASSNGSKSR